VPHQTIRPLVALALLGAVFLKGFKKAIGIAVFSVAAYLLLNSCAETDSDFKDALTLAQVFRTRVSGNEIQGGSPPSQTAVVHPVCTLWAIFAFDYLFVFYRELKYGKVRYR
jgi:hypothetical protein